jgi:hypothetical protein
MKDNFCIVGLGNHSLTKIIPALELEKKNILGVVTSKTNLEKKSFQCFRNLLDAILSLPHDTIFVVSTPPLIHFKQIELLIEYNRNVFVEKPIFTSFKEAKYINKLISKKKIFVTETLMYKYTNLYTEFVSYWDIHKHKIKNIKCNFTIPNFPKNTFRNRDDVHSSCLYDIGCYIITLIIDLNINFLNIEIIKIIRTQNKIKNMNFKFVCTNFNIECFIGVSKSYENKVSLELIDSQILLFEPFFYGRKGDRLIIEKKKDTKDKKQLIKEENAYRKLFNIDHELWLSSQNLRFKNLLKVNKILEEISKQTSILN